MSLRSIVASATFLGIVAVAGGAQAALVGSWNFAGATPLTDGTGNFSNVVLSGTAAVNAGALDISGSGTTTTGWATVSGYTGPTIDSMTMVVWGTLQALQSSAYAGAMMSISATSGDKFDAIDYGEASPNTWVAGSSGFSRTQAFSPGYTETSANLNTLFEIALTYNDLGNGTEQVTGYINGNSIGSYVTGNVVTWSSDALIAFGPRAYINGTVYGGIDATISGAELYNTALSQSQIQSLSEPGSAVPEPATTVLLGAGLFGLWGVRRRTAGR